MRYDVIVMGAGLAGMIAMARFASAGFCVLGIERMAPAPLDAQDLRSTAFLMPSVAVLEKAGLWDGLSQILTPLDVMEIVDARQTPPKAVAFNAVEIDQPHFGFNLINSELHAALRQHLQNAKNVTLKFDTQIQKLMQFSDYVALKSSKGGIFEGRILVGADGRNSQTRALLKIEAEKRPIDQWAQVFTVTHEKPHANISTEIHDQGGPFTLVPRQDIDGQHASAIVWMDKPEAVKAREQMTMAQFKDALNARSFGWRGTLERVGALGAFPMMSLEAEKLSEHRGVILGEAAHVVPPIGAQGLNMSLRDIESLVRVLERGGLEHPKYLGNWARQRKMDITLRERGIRMLNQVSIGDMRLSDQLRRMGLDVLEKQSPLKSGLMKLGLGAS